MSHCKAVSWGTNIAIFVQEKTLLYTTVLQYVMIASKIQKEIMTYLETH